LVVPMLLWGFLTSQTTMARRRLGFELVLGILVLLSSFARAGIVAAAFACTLACISLRQYRLIVKGFSAALVLAVAAVMFMPAPQQAPKWDGSQAITDMFLYKGKPEQGLMGSRKGPWDQTLSVIKDRPWFGSGFGTSLTGQDLTKWEFGR